MTMRDEFGFIPNSSRRATTEVIRELYDSAYELGGLLIEARAGVVHQPETIRTAIEQADEARSVLAEIYEWSYGAMADAINEAQR